MVSTFSFSRWNRIFTGLWYVLSRFCLLLSYYVKESYIEYFYYTITNYYFRFFNKQFGNLEWWLFGFVDVFRSNIFYAT